MRSLRRGMNGELPPLIIYSRPSRIGTCDYRESRNDPGFFSSSVSRAVKYTIVHYIVWISITTSWPGYSIALEAIDVSGRCY
jgi:hypothetical protein